MLYLDDRLDTLDMERHLVKLGAKVERRPLQAGADAVIIQEDRSCGIQFKSVGDMLSASITGTSSQPFGRLYQQLRDLESAWGLAILLIIGHPKPSADGFLISEGRVSGWTYIAYEALKVSIAQRGVVVQEVGGIASAAYAIMAWHEGLGKEPGDARRTVKKVKAFSFGGKIHPAIVVLSAFPSINVSTSKELLKQFGTLKAVINADYDELIMAHDIGPSRARAIITVSEMLYKEEGHDATNASSRDS